MSSAPPGSCSRTSRLFLYSAKYNTEQEALTIAPSDNLIVVWGSLVGFRLPKKSLGSAIVRIHESLGSDFRAISEAERRMSWYATDGRAASFTTYGRVIEAFDLCGFVAAKLIEPQPEVDPFLAMGRSELDRLLEEQPLTNEELVEANRSGRGCSLLVTDLYWKPQSRWGLDIEIAEQALTHLTRWFEGNSIKQVFLPVNKSIAPILEPVFDSLEKTITSRREVDSGLILFVVKRPYARVSIGDRWIGRLLRSHEDPPVHIALESDRLIGKHFHEFDFRIADAVGSTLPTWTLNPAKGKRAGTPSNHGSASAHAWRTTIADDLDAFLDKSDETNTMGKIQRMVGRFPRLLTLY